MRKKLINSVRTTSNAFVSSKVYYNFIIVENVRTKISKKYEEIGALANNHCLFLKICRSKNLAVQEFWTVRHAMLNFLAVQQASLLGQKKKKCMLNDVAPLVLALES